MNTPAQAGSAQRKEQRIASLKSHEKGAPTPRAREKRELSLAWLGIFGTLTTPTLKRILEIKGEGYLPKLHKEGLVDRHDIGKLNGKIWTLTPKGQEAAALILGWEPNRVRGDKLNISIASHNELAQLAALQLFQKTQGGVSVERIRRLTVERELRQKGIAVPDVVYVGTLPDGSGVSWGGIEIELNPKGHKELKDKMIRLIELMVQHRLCEKLVIGWYLKSETEAARYMRVWEEAMDKVKSHVRNNEYPAGTRERMQNLPYPICCTSPLPQ